MKDVKIEEAVRHMKRKEATQNMKREKNLNIQVMNREKKVPEALAGASL
jgi:hypothetical protein